MNQYDAMPVQYVRITPASALGVYAMSLSKPNMKTNTRENQTVVELVTLEGVVESDGDAFGLLRILGTLFLIFLHRAAAS